MIMKARAIRDIAEILVAGRNWAAHAARWQPL
jgi:hypothetical protein